MADRDKLEDERLKNCIQDAYGYSDEDLLREMEEAEASLDETEFLGAEDRIFQRILEREASEKEAGKKEVGENAEPEGGAVVSGRITNSKTSSVSKEEKRRIRIGKKKILLAAALVALFAGLLGVSAVGEKNYFFRQRNKMDFVVLNNDKNRSNAGSLDEIYEEIEEKCGTQILKMGYVPSELIVSGVAAIEDYYAITFDYGDEKIYYLLEYKKTSYSTSVNSDRDETTDIYNNWLKKYISVSCNTLENKKTEWEAVLELDNMIYRLSGVMEQEEFEKIVKNLHYF